MISTLRLRSGFQAASAQLKSYRELAYTIFLFTRSDIKTIVAPSLVVGTCHGAAMLMLDSDPTQGSQSAIRAIAAVLQRVPVVALYTWINLLPFDIDNQRRPDSIKEDALNKPWRVLPSGRMTPEVAVWVMRLAYVVAFAFSMLVGAPLQCLALIFLGYCYNAIGGSDQWFARNLLNAFGIVSFLSGATQVALANSKEIDSLAMLNWWYATIATIIFTTIQILDLCDLEGDLARGRRTLPIKIGDAATRWLTAAIVMFWSLFCPWQWSVSLAGLLLPLAAGLVISWRVLCLRSVAADRMTAALWNGWMMTLFTLPFVKALQSTV